LCYNEKCQWYFTTYYISMNCTSKTVMLPLLFNLILHDLINVCIAPKPFQYFFNIRVWVYDIFIVFSLKWKCVLYEVVLPHPPLLISTHTHLCLALPLPRIPPSVLPLIWLQNGTTWQVLVFLCAPVPKWYFFTGINMHWWSHTEWY